MRSKPNTSLAGRAGSWSARNKKKAIFGWLAFVVIAFVLGGAVGTRNLDDDDTGAGQSAQAAEILRDAFPAGGEEQVIVSSRDPAALKAAVTDVQGTVERFSFVRLQAPVTSQDGRSVLVPFELPGDDETAQEKQIVGILSAVEAAQKRHPDTQIGEFGSASAGKALSERFESDFKKAETLSIPITLAILVLAFGALVAAGLPVLLALSAVAASLGIVALPSQILPVDESIASLILLIGMAVGVDYSLFYLRRAREERDAGHAPLEAIDIAAATSGRAVLVSGVTVMIAMAGMFLTGDATFMSFAMGTIIVVAAAMIGSLTVLPAMMAALGTKVDRGRVPFLHRLRRADGESRLWNAILDRVLRRPKLSLLAATALLLALAAPALQLKTATSGLDDLPRDLAVMQTYDRIQAAFPGDQIPATVVVRGDDVTASPMKERIADLQRATRDLGPATVEVSEDRTVAAVAVPLPGDGTNAASTAALERLRERDVPRTVGSGALVTGLTAESEDFNALMARTAPYVFGFVLSLAFLLLLVTFRSVVIPIKAIALNLLSVAAAYGAMELAFDDPIVSWLPMFLFVILFGLSMDYHVFILSRVREAYDSGMDTDAAVAHGIKTTAGVVTSAAAVMVAVFSIFGTLTFIDMRQMGVGLAVAVLIDATIVRAVLLPAAMTLLGDRNWYLPSWMSWLPRLDHGTGVPQPAGATA
jgi:RND superfamily putative drug exporter